ncbi:MULTISPECIES: hypothetical protein [unclassified Microcoleus]|uniref:hypothetical protein n=1 Tax=unclassified Microcoleus TaxID=2642155 RepID=UPI002FCF20AE
MATALDLRTVAAVAALRPCQRSNHHPNSHQPQRARLCILRAVPDTQGIEAIDTRRSAL